MVRRIIASCLLLCTVIPEVSAKTWIVAKDGSGDFTEIQAAIDAAVDGDVVVVRPGTYEKIKVKYKRLAIVGSGPDVTVAEYDMFGSHGQHAAEIWSNSQVLLAHMTLHAPHPYASSASSGEVIASNVVLLRDYEADDFSTGSGLFHTLGEALFCRCLVQDLIPPDITAPAGSPAGAWLDPGMTVISQAYLNGHEGDHGNSGDTAKVGGAGIRADSTELYLAEVSTLGGLGGQSWLGGIYCDEMRDAERGGHGLELLTGAQVVSATRDASTLVQGGKGGSGDPVSPDCGGVISPGGPGGDGVNADATSMAFLSGPFTIIPGVGGDGNPVGPPGLPTVGNVLVEPDPYPTMTIGGTGAIGSMLTLNVHGNSNDRVFLIISDNFAKGMVGGIGGFPLFASPGGSFFRVVPAGTIGSGPPLAIHFTLPDDVRLIGKLALFQALIIPENTLLEPRLTNVVAEIMRDH